MSKKKLNKTVWYSSEVDVSGNPILPPLAENPEDLEGLHEGELFLHNSDDYPSIWIRTKNGLIKPLIGGQSNTPSYWEVRELPNGDTYLYTSLPIVTQSGVTMYADGGILNLPSIYDGLPIDNNTIYWENGILKAKGGGGIAESVSWADITGKPEWLLDGKISYSEVEGTPDLSVYALKRSLSEYVTKTELSDLDYADKDWVKEYVVDINTGNITAITNQMVIDALGYTPYNSTNPAGYITSTALNGYATQDWVTKRGYLTSIPSEYVTETELTNKGYATTSDLDSRINALINGAPDAYDTLQEIADVLQGNVNSIGDILKALGGKADKAKTLSGYGITDAYTKTEVNTLLNDNATQTWVKSQGYLTQHQDLSGYQKLITSSNKLAYALISGTPTALPNPTALKFGTKSYDGSAERTILASDLGALTSHQAIYTLTFQSGTFASGSFTANSGNKTINIPTTTSHVSEGSNLYFTNARAVSALGDTLKSYVTLSGSQTVSGEKNFTGGFKVNGSPIVYDAAKKYWKLEGDLLITGGLTMYGSDSSFTPSTIMDAIAVDGTTISKDGGVLKVIGGGGAITSITKQMVVNALGFTPISSSDIPKTLPNPYVLKFGTKEYDGNVSKTILASDLGALTAHQTIYSLTVKDSAGTTKLTYTPNSGTGSITLTKAMVGLGNVDNIAASGYLTALSSNTTNAVSITVGGTTKSITSATMKASLGLGSLAYKSSLTASDIPNLDWLKITSGKPTTLSGYGITDAKIASGVITLGSSSITPLTGITSALVTGALGYTPYNAANFTKANIKSTLGISDWALAASKPSYTWDDILGRPTLLSSFTDDVVAGKYLPLSGGTITIDLIYSLSVKRNGTGGSFVAYENNNGNLGFLGVGDDGVPKFAASDGVGKKIWHEGNFTPTNYLPLTGGTISGDVVWEAGTGNKTILPGHIYRNLHGSSGNIYDHYCTSGGMNTFANLRVGSNDNGGSYKTLRFGGDGTFTWDGKTIIHSGNYSSYALPLTGGTINGTTHTPIAINTTSTSEVGLRFDMSGAHKGWVGYTPNIGIYLYSYGTSGVTHKLGISDSGAGIIDSYALYHTGNLTKLSQLTNDSGFITSSASITGNAASATKLKTARTIWGQSFDGSADVNGMMYDHLGSEMLYSSGVWLRIGNGLAKKGYPTYIDGNIVYLRYGTGLNNGLTLDSSGNVGIGTTSPSQKLHVDGNILTTGGITMYSQKSLKNIVDEEGLTLEQLKTIKPTRYTWKDNRDNRTHFGGIADDIQQVLPEVVYNASGVLTMDYGNAGFAIASSLIKPVVDHEQRIKALEKENEELKQEIKRLRA